MALFKEISKENKRFNELIEKISREIDCDKLIVLHFINADLEKIYKSSILIDEIQLQHLKNEVAKYLKTELELKQKIEKSEIVIKELQSNIDNHTLSLSKKEELINNKKEELVELKKKLTQINVVLAENEQQKKQTEYDIMMKNHAKTKKNDKSYKYIKIYLSLITFIAIIIVTFLIFKK